MGITIRKSKQSDFPEILSMIQELADFEKCPDQVTNSVQQMNKEKDCFRCFVAEDEKGKIVGMAVYFFAYYTWVGKSLYLDDLYVREWQRGKKVWTKLLWKIFEEAKKENCKRVRWQVIDWNTPAIKMYEKLWADIDSGWSNCDFDEAKIKDMEL